MTSTDLPYTAEPHVFVLGPTAAAAERWARDRRIPTGRWHVVVDDYQLHGRAAGHTLVVLNGAFRHRRADRVAATARCRGMRVAYENELCEHREPCNRASPATCFHPDYVAQVAECTARAGIGWGDVLWERAPGLAARVREHRAAGSADKRDTCGCHRDCTSVEHECVTPCRWPACLTVDEAAELARDVAAS